MDEIKIVIEINPLATQIEKHKVRFVKSFKAVKEAYEKRAKKYQEDYSKWLANGSKGNQPQPPMAPVDRTKIYDFYLAMLTNHTETTIEIAETKFRELFLDEWSWLPRHVELLSAYASDSTAVCNALDSYTETSGSFE